MLLSNDFVVAADLEQVWAHLLDMEVVASCVPGARIEEVVPPSTYKGTIRLKIGPMTVEYRGQATLVEVDEGGHRATIEMKAREARGQGSALATVRNRLEPVAGGTRVIAETDLQITGPQAQFGKGVLEDVGSRILAEFSARLERVIRDGHGGAGEPGARAGASTNGQRAAKEPSSCPSGAGGDAGGPESRATTAGASSRSAVTGPPWTPDDGDTLDLNSVLRASLLARLPKMAMSAALLCALAATGILWRRAQRHRTR
jgi:carbon monoxide dehydrogenase subunit G